MPNAPSFQASQATSNAGTAATFNLVSAITLMSSGGLGHFPGADAVSMARASSQIVGSVLDPTTCSFSSAVDGFACPTSTVGGTTRTVSFWLYDQNGQSLPSFDAATVASVRLVADYSGSTTYSSGVVDTSSGHSDLTLSGLLTANRRLTGSAESHGEDIISGDPIHRVSDMRSATSLLLPAQIASQYPAVGTITINFSSIGAPSVGVLSVLTFDGSGYALLADTVAPSTSPATCRVDLSTGNESCQ
ncbi:MAG: hypothetical protein ACREPM_15470 [Gemmatimonadaceae bacterium]